LQRKKGRRKEELGELTEREEEILCSISLGKDLKVISHELSINRRTEETPETHLPKIKGSFPERGYGLGA